MSKLTLGFTTGTFFAIVGVVIASQAGGLATEWNGALGVPDALKAHTFEAAGLLVLGFGLVLNAIVFARWIWSPDR